MTGWHWHPSVVLGLEGLLVAYLVGVGPLRRRYGWGPAAGRAKVAAFAGGVGVLAVALLGPLAEWAERVALSAHMVQHLLILFVVPPLWLYGTPDWLLRPALRLPGAGRAGYWLTRPAIALGLASTVQVGWHLPPMYDAALHVEALHALEHVTLLGSALLLWWPLAGPLPEWPRPSPPARLLYVFLCTIPMMAIAAPITLAEEVLYPFYAREGLDWPLGPRADQELAGILMWVGGMFGYLVAGTVVFFRWVAHEVREDGDDVPTGALAADTPPAPERAAHGHA